MNIQKDIIKSIRAQADMMLTCIKCLDRIDSELVQEKKGPAAKHLKFRIEHLEFQKKEWNEKLEQNQKRLKESVKFLEMAFEKEVGQKMI